MSAIKNEKLVTAVQRAAQRINKEHVYGEPCYPNGVVELLYIYVANLDNYLQLRQSSTNLELFERAEEIVEEVANSISPDQARSARLRHAQWNGNLLRI